MRQIIPLHPPFWQMLKKSQIVGFNMQMKVLVFSLLWTLSLGCKSSPPPQESCDYCPDCARVSTGHIGGVSNFATIADVSTGCTIVQYCNFFRPLD